MNVIQRSYTMQKYLSLSYNEFCKAERTVATPFADVRSMAEQYLAEVYGLTTEDGVRIELLFDSYPTVSFSFEPSHTRWWKLLKYRSALAKALYKHEMTWRFSDEWRAVFAPRGLADDEEDRWSTVCLFHSALENDFMLYCNVEKPEYNPTAMLSEIGYSNGDYSNGIVLTMHTFNHKLNDYMFGEVRSNGIVQSGLERGDFVDVHGTPQLNFAKWDIRHGKIVPAM